MPTGSDDARFEFLKRLARALAPLGQTSGELQGQLYACARGLGMKTEFVVLPTYLQIYWKAGSEDHTVIIPVSDGSIDLRRLGALQELAVAVGKGRLTPEQGLRRLKELDRRPPRFPVWMSLVAGLLSTFTIAVIIGGGVNEVVAAVPTGLAVGLFYRLAAATQRFQGVLELSAAAFTTAFALGLGHLLKDFDPTIVVIAALVQFLPGLRITQGVSELTAGDLVAGTARLAGAVVTLFNLGIGVAVVWALFWRFGAVPPVGHASGSPMWMLVVAVAAGAIAYSVTENARPRDVGWVLLGVVSAVVGSRLGAWALGPTLGVGLASLIVGVLGNAYSRFLHHPKATITVPGLLILVPGALGFRGMFSAVSSGGTAGGDILLSTITVAAALVVGLSLGETIIRPRTLPEPVSSDEAVRQAR